jgi:hypothetical protein
MLAFFPQCLALVHGCLILNRLCLQATLVLTASYSSRYTMMLNVVSKDKQSYKIVQIERNHIQADITRSIIFVIFRLISR